MSIQRIGGSILMVGPQVAYKSEVVAADFTAVTPWTQVNAKTTIGDLETTREGTSQALIDTDTMEYGKGVKTFGTFTVAVSPRKNSAGHKLMRDAVDDCLPRPFRLQNGGDCEIVQPVTISAAAPGVVTWTGHPLLAGDVVSFSTTGALPTGLVAGTLYYVVNPTADAFSVAAIPGGTGITTSGAGTGIQTITAIPGGWTRMFYGHVMGATLNGGGGSDNFQETFTVQPISNNVVV